MLVSVYQSLKICTIIFIYSLHWVIKLNGSTHKNEIKYWNSVYFQEMKFYAQQCKKFIKCWTFVHISNFLLFPFSFILKKNFYSYHIIKFLNGAFTEISESRAGKLYFIMLAWWESIWIRWFVVTDTSHFIV